MEETKSISSDNNEGDSESFVVNLAYLHFSQEISPQQREPFHENEKVDVTKCLINEGFNENDKKVEPVGSSFNGHTGAVLEKDSMVPVSTSLEKHVAKNDIFEFRDRTGTDLSDITMNSYAIPSLLSRTSTS